MSLKSVLVVIARILSLKKSGLLLYNGAVYDRIEDMSSHIQV